MSIDTRGHFVLDKFIKKEMFVEFSTDLFGKYRYNYNKKLMITKMFLWQE